MKFAVFSHIAEKATASPKQRLDEYAAEIRLTDELGYDYFFTTEHHFSGRFSMAPSQPVTLTVIAQNSERLRFGPMVIQLPLSQPLRVVEELLILDHMSGGRLEMGFGRGITPHEHTTYGISTQSDRARFEEGLEFVIKAFTTDEPFSFVGEYYTYVDVDLPWRSVQQPHPPIWIPTNTPSSAYEYGKKGYGVGGFAIVGMDLYDTVFAEYHRGCDEAGIPLDARPVSYLASTIVAETDAEAEALAKEHFPKQMSLFEEERRRSARVGGAAVREAAKTSLGRLAGIKENLAASAEQLRFIHGSPETVAAKIDHLRERLGVDVFIGEFSFGELSFDEVRRSHELMMSEVAPRLAGAASVAVG
jgi:alkanesulfonate monooxygenase SsuD/methylene tetrahydromethanopterin reductase-like flavin-dependent oxidoreductase (luciferase family)